MVLIASCYTVLDALGPGVQSRHLVLPDQPLPPPLPRLCAGNRIQIVLLFTVLN